MGGCCSAQNSLRAATNCFLSPSPTSTPALSSHSFNYSTLSILPSALSNSSSILRYGLSDELGRGEFGHTRRCTDFQTGEVLACKTISKRKLRSKVDVADVQREVEIMRVLPAHPNIVGLKDAFEDKEAVHLIMEVCEGGELFDRIVARGHYTERAAAGIMKTIMDVVEHCHKNGVMHRDLKPENFLFANESESSPLKAIDFGLSVFFSPGERFDEIVGSAFYMAPEVFKRNYGPEIDVWSAGVILYILLCGVPPFWAESDEGIMQDILYADIELESEPWSKISDNAKDLVRCMLDRNSATRLTAKQVLEHPWLLNANAVPNIPLGETVTMRLKQFSTMNKFKKKALRVVADHLPVEEIAGIKHLFHMLDTDKSGTLTIEELKNGDHIIAHHVPDLDIHMLMEAADEDGNGTLDCGEFVTVTIHLKKIKSEDYLPKVFSYFDKDGNGFIENHELTEALKEDNLGLNEQAIEQIIHDVDTDKDGRISYDEFVTMMGAGTEWKSASCRYSQRMFNTLSVRLLKDSSKRTTVRSLG